MAKIHARNVDLYAGGREITTRSNAATLTQNADAPDVTTFRSDNRERLHLGIRDIEMSVNGFTDMAASQVDATFNSLLAASDFWGLYPESTATSSRGGREFVGIVTEYNQDYATDAAAAFSVTVAASGAVALTTSLYGGSTSSGSNAACSVNFGASSASTSIFFRIMALGGTSPDLSACFQHSGNDSSWTTGIDFGVAASSGCVMTTASLSSASQYRRLRYALRGTSPTACIMISSGSFMKP